MSFLDDMLEPVEATLEQIQARAAAFGDRGTAGPDGPPTIDSVEHAPSPRWLNGWWQGAVRMPAHPGRVGGPIAAFLIGVHTTDMLSGTRSGQGDEWVPLVRAWTERPGDGACANFLFGRDEAHGVLQFVSILRNANHMGGPGHGVIDTARATGLHPNNCAIGIEFHCAGGVRRIGGAWRLVEGGVAHGAPVPDEEVTPDPARPGRGWHNLTDYQRARFADLLRDLEPVLGPLPAGVRARATGAEQPDPIAVMPAGRLVTHWQLDPVHRGDPWRPACEWLRGL